MSLDPSSAHRKETKTTSTGWPYTTYWFRCACGVEISSQHSYLKRHSGKCRSCSQKGRPFQSAYTSLLSNQKTRGIRVDLTYDQFVALCAEQSCHYCSEPIYRSLKRGEAGYRGYFVDRKDNNQPYIVGNCVPCCWRCNQAKGNRFSYDQFVEIASKYLRIPAARAASLCELNGWDPWD